MPLEPGIALGPHHVAAKIGECGRGEVYQARDSTLDRNVALKVSEDDGNYLQERVEITDVQDAAPAVPLDSGVCRV